MGYNQHKKLALNSKAPLGFRYVNLLRCITHICNLRDEKFNELLVSLKSGFQEECPKQTASQKLELAICKLDKLRNPYIVKTRISKSHNDFLIPKDIDIENEISTYSKYGINSFFKNISLLLSKVGVSNEKKQLTPITKSEVKRLFHNEFSEVSSIVNYYSETLYETLDKKLKHLSDSLAFLPQRRNKEWPSIVDKIVRLNSNTTSEIESRIDSLTDLQDLIGFRVVTVFEKDLKKIEKIIKRNFSIKRIYIPSYMNHIHGYQSKHIIIESHIRPNSQNKLESSITILAEIQLMTLAQFTFAKASHSLIYKNNSKEKLPVVRSLQRASVLLESVDIEFSRNFDSVDN